MVKADRSKGSPATTKVSHYVCHAGLSMHRGGIVKRGVLTGRGAGAKGNRPEC